MTWENYERLAEFHDLFMTEAWERLRPRVRSALAHLGETSVVVEIGAGSGIGTRTIAAETRARIFAVEPALVMRSILTARVADHPQLADRVTVVAGSVPDDLGEVPAGIDAFVCAHMLGHLDRETRRGLFAWLGSHLRPGGVGLVTTQERPEAPAGRDGDTLLVETRTIGDYEYRAHHLRTGRPGRHSSRYEVWRGSTLVRSESFEGRWEAVTAGDVAADLPPSLALEVVASGVALIRSRDGRPSRDRRAAR
ncbi:class I SAM-dependent methyltransferase [Jiangella anatolica]|uniref:Methyltransferase domain-containing protein n=1 Tax=Jiangella anatolica TaxID=2670374 RepID=A0A2W2C9D5_9ACTN|nr:class I SAM-dependent methyltransferase [Jiangella anatolica]PZF84807.1 hypothetical protein C1I92_07000 [Jiangella anatolica]